MGFKTPKQRARMSIVQALYQWLLIGGSIDLISSHTLMNQRGKTATVFFHRTLEGIIKELAELTALIQTKLKHNINEIAPIDLAIIYLGAYELKQGKLARAIIINEAIELAKQYGTSKADKFIHQLLDKITLNEQTN